MFVVVADGVTSGVVTELTSGLTFDQPVTAQIKAAVGSILIGHANSPASCSWQVDPPAAGQRDDTVLTVTLLPGEKLYAAAASSPAEAYALFCSVPN